MVCVGVERKKRDKAARRKNDNVTVSGSGDIEALDDSPDDDILESVIKSVTTPASRQTRDRRRARTGTRTSCQC